MDRYDPVFAPAFRRRVKVRKFTRTKLREIIRGKKRTPHGGRGRKYGLKGGKKQKASSLAALMAKLGIKR